MPEIVYHQSNDALAKQAAKGIVTLAPGPNNAYGLGVYASENGRYYYDNRAATIAIPVTPEARWERCAPNIWAARECITMRVQKNTEPAPDGGILYTATTVTAIPETIARIRMAGKKAKPSKSLGGRYRMLGITLACACAIVFLIKRTRRENTAHKWLALARFLLGIGGEYKPPKTIILEGLKHTAQCEATTDPITGELTGYTIRPESHTALFWIVGTMTIQYESGKLHGKDIYDFHPQFGQHTIQGPTAAPCWAWSGGPGDPTQIPIKLGRYINLEKATKKVFPKLYPRYVKRVQGKLAFSNDVWNALGGKPFRTVIELTAEETTKFQQW